MKNLLYVGNKLSKDGNTATAIEVLGPLLEKGGCKVTYASSKKNMFLRFLDMIYATIKSRNTADYVLIDTYSTLNFWYAFFVSQLCRILKIKYIPILHGGNLPARLHKNPRFSKMIFAHSHANVAPSNYLLEEFTSCGFHVVYIPNAITLADFPFFHRETISPKILWVRAFSPIYNPEMALKAFSIVQNKYPSAELCMIGPDKTGIVSAIKEMAKKENLNVVFTGKMTKSAWAARSQQYDIFINTARIDNTPYSIIEAAALGLCIVSTDVGGIPYLLKDQENAILVGDDDGESMAAAIDIIVNNLEISRKLIRNGQILAAQFDWEIVKEKWTEILI